jgi:hypothetical protein
MSQEVARTRVASGCTRPVTKETWRKASSEKGQSGKEPGLAWHAVADEAYTVYFSTHLIVVIARIEL